MATNIPRSPKIAKDGRCMSPASLANLKPPYKKGENGHQFGGFNLKERLKHELRRHPEKAEEIIRSTIEGCILREPTPFKEVWDRLEGKVPEPTKSQPEQGNRIINIFVGTDRAKQMVEGLTGRLLQQENGKETRAVE